MRIDVILPSESVDEDTRDLVGLAVAAERHGFGALWLPDHPLPPRGYDRTYGGVHEPLMTLAHLAAHTTAIRLGTSVVIAPLREPVLLAKQVATLEALAPGRVLLGVGAGWERSEFDAVGADFADRGRRTDEVVTAVRDLHRTGRGPGGGVLAPRPSTPVPIVVGGTTGPALRRAARLGDVWQAVGLAPDAFVTARERLATLAGRPVAAGTRVNWQPGSSLDDLLEELGRWRRADPDHVAVWMGGIADAAARLPALGAALDGLR